MFSDHKIDLSQQLQLLCFLGEFRSFKLLVSGTSFELLFVLVVVFSCWESSFNWLIQLLVKVRMRFFLQFFQTCCLSSAYIDHFVFFHLINGSHTSFYASNRYLIYSFRLSDGSILQFDLFWSLSFFRDFLC